MTALAQALAAELLQALRDPKVAAGLAEAMRPVVREELARQEEPAVLDSTGACRLFGYLHPDGRPNLPALNALLQRHADLPVQRVGRRLRFGRVALEQWIARHPRPGRGEQDPR